MKNIKNIAIIGGGASGFFAGIQCAQRAQELGGELNIHIFESSPRFLSKVKISGGGRCNVTHHQYNPAIFSKNYPRGSRELRSPFTQFQAADTVEWFRGKGVELHAEEDGRMFPKTNSSDTIIECFVKSAIELGIHLRSRSGVKHIEKTECGSLRLHLKPSTQANSGQTGVPDEFIADKVLIATGSAKQGYAFASSLGHTITELAPSLFSFKTENALIKGLAGTSFPYAKLSLKLPEKKFSQEGPLLITHRGLSGPAILKLSAWAAREMKRANYQAQLSINWSGHSNQEEVAQDYQRLKSAAARSQLKNASPNFFTKRFWKSFLQELDIDENKTWDETSKKSMNRLVEATFSTKVKILGQNRFKDEFVECGGVKLSEVDLKTMESKLCPGLFFSGEVLDIDGITGGFNFQNAWTTGYIAGSNMAKQALPQ